MSAPARFRAVAELFEAARTMAPAERAAFLERAGRDRPDVIDEVRALLAHHESDDGLLAAPIAPPPDLDAAPPRRIGRYRIERTLGCGGMGAVYLAEQEHPRRKVAIKVIRPGLVSRELLRRFEREAEVLGRLQHPGIAQIHEAGTYDDGAGPRPYFAMELVDGAPIMTHARERGLDLRGRLEVFVRVCDAMEHAHQKGVIHRDLKPGNILVDPSGQPRILDFGIARVTDGDLQVSTLRTDAGRLLGTVAYMSPEQVGGRARDVDTRSDVYALGVLLYELIADRLPYDLGDRTIAAAARVIAEQEPTALTTIHRSFRGDLDTIVRKALEKDPERRYASAADLGADVRRFLADEPIVARPATTMYQLRKFARRHKGLVAGVVIAFVALAAGTVAATAGMVRAGRDAERAQAMSAFLESVLVAADSARSGDVRLVDLLRDAGARVDGEFGGHPEVAARVHRLLAAAFSNILYHDESARHARRWLELTESLHGADAPETRRPRVSLARALEAQMELDEAERLLHVVLDGGGPDDATALEARIALGALLTTRGRYDASEAVLRPALTRADATLGRSHHLAVRARMCLGNCLDNRGLHGDDPPAVRDALREEGATYYRQVIEDEARGSVRLLTGLRARQRLSDFARATGRYDEAAQHARTGMELVEARLGPDHPFMGRFEKRLGRALYGLGAWDEAADLMVRSVTRSRDTERDSTQALIDMVTAMPMLDAARRWETALDYAERIADRLGPSPAHGGSGLEAHIWIPYLHVRLGDPETAGPLLAALDELVPWMDQRNLVRLHYVRGVRLAATGDAAARAELEQALDGHDGARDLWPSRAAIEAALDELPRTAAGGV